METPSSSRRVTRSQTSAAPKDNHNNNNIPISNFEKGVSNSRQRKAKQQDRSALIDITNDSPIVGLAMGTLETPLSSIVKQKSFGAKKTPGSGEALLRGQVKTLLQKVEEEAELSKLSLESRPFLHLKGIVNSPAGLLAPTPANTPQVSNLSGDNETMNINNNGSSSEAPSPVVEEHLISQMVDENEKESLESQKSIITRSLLLDFSEKSDSYDSSECSSVMTYQGVEGDIESKEKPTPDDDNASMWSVQVNASTLGEEDEEEEVEDGEGGDCYLEEGDEIEVEEEQSELIDELCECISKINMNEKIMIPKFEGKHTRFEYDSDDEIIEEEAKQSDESANNGGASSPSILRLNGLPTPKGKHLRFTEEEEEHE